MNPKDSIGAKKAPIGVVPPALMIGAAEAMQTGAVKYGPFNYRENKVQAVTYYEAICRHLFAWFDGQEVAEDTGVHHLRHVAAGVGILLDALDAGNLIDNRPVKGPSADMLRALDRSTKPTVDQGVADPTETNEWLTPEQAAANPEKVLNLAPVFNGTRFLCGHSFGEEPTVGGDRPCGTAIHWSRVNGIERRDPEPWDETLVQVCEDSGNHVSGRHLLSCPEFHG